jgi:hypothetical protein
MDPKTLHITEVTASEYHELTIHECHLFNTAQFAAINRPKCEAIYFLVFGDTKFRLGLTAGVRNGKLVSPFSAPFGGFSFLRQDVQLIVIEKAVEALEEFAKQKGLLGIQIVLPPLIYNETFLAKQMNVFYRKGYQNTNLDLDFYIQLQSKEPYEELLWYNARKNLRISQQQGFEVVLCNKDANAKAVIYEVIKENRVSKGKPMNMSFEDIIATEEVIPTDFFLLRQGIQPIAGGIVYSVAKSIRYVPFWGDFPGYTVQKPMNFLSHYIVQYYRQAGEKYLHIGISTENSLPNYGLCEFKESIGCTITPKMSFEKIF